jgi:hypothetical protein
MSSFNATESAVGNAYTSTTPSYLVTSNSSATASSNLSQKNAEKKAKQLAQQVANSAAQNDAHIISQALALSPAGVIDQYSYLNTSYAIKTAINGQGEFDGLIKPEITDETVPDALIITAKKKIYDSTTFKEIPNSEQLATINSTFYNYGGIYGDKIIEGKVFSSLTPKSVISSNRISSTELPVILNNHNSYKYKIKILTRLKYYLDKEITNSTGYIDLNRNVYGLKVDSKHLTGLNIINETDNTITTYTGATIKESYTDDKQWNIISLDLSRAFAGSVIPNIYPVDINI